MEHRQQTRDPPERLSTFPDARRRRDKSAPSQAASRTPAMRRGPRVIARSRIAAASQRAWARFPLLCTVVSAELVSALTHFPCRWRLPSDPIRRTRQRLAGACVTMGCWETSRTVRGLNASNENRRQPWRALRCQAQDLLSGEQVQRQRQHSAEYRHDMICRCFVSNEECGSRRRLGSKEVGGIRPSPTHVVLGCYR